jgi:hypothetical protein
MIFRRLLMGFVAITAISTAAGVVVVALAFTLYALVQPYIGNAGASATVAGAFALLAIILGFVAMPRRRHRRGNAANPASPEGVASDLMDLVRDKPVASAGIAVAAGIMAMRNPRVIGEIARAFFQSRRNPRAR